MFQQTICLIHNNLHFKRLRADAIFAVPNIPLKSRILRLIKYMAENQIFTP
nr:MAG TPA: hypothetical protein [Bacteriophage sp.]